MDDLLIVPRDVLQSAYDALEQIPDWADAGSDTWILYHQLGSILQRMAQDKDDLPTAEDVRGILSRLNSSIRYTGE